MTEGRLRDCKLAQNSSPVVTIIIMTEGGEKGERRKNDGRHKISKRCKIAIALRF